MRKRSTPPKEKNVIDLIFNATDMRYSDVFGCFAYWAKKPSNVIQHYITYFTDQGDIILDPFAGIGVVPVEALRAKEEGQHQPRRGIGIDLSAWSVFLMKHILMPLDYSDLDRIERFWEKNKERLYSKIFPLYKVPCPNCGKETTISEVRYDDVSGTKSGDPREMEHKLKAYKVDCEECGRVWKVESGAKKVKNIGKTATVKKVDSLKEEKERLEEIRNRNLPPHPEWPLIPNTRKSVYKGMTTDDIYTKRNLFAMSYLREFIFNITNPKIREFFRFVFASSLHLMRKTDYKRASPRNYYVPSRDMTSLNVLKKFEKKIPQVRACKEAIWKSIWKKLPYDFSFSDWNAESFEEIKEGDKWVMIKKGSSTDLSNIIEKGSIDYVHTDPPYADQVQYLELAIPWIAWIGIQSEEDFHEDLDEEIVLTDAPDREDKMVNTTKGVDNYTQLMRNSIIEIKNVLKKNAWASIWYCCSDEGHWDALVQDLNRIGLGFKGKPIPVKRPIKTFGVNVAELQYKRKEETLNKVEAKLKRAKSRIREIETLFSCKKGEKTKIREPKGLEEEFTDFVHERLSESETPVPVGDLFSEFLADYSSKYYKAPPSDPLRYQKLLFHSPEFKVDFNEDGNLIARLTGKDYEAVRVKAGGKYRLFWKLKSRKKREEENDEES